MHGAKQPEEHGCINFPLQSGDPGVKVQSIDAFKLDPQLTDQDGSGRCGKRPWLRLRSLGCPLRTTAARGGAFTGMVSPPGFSRDRSLSSPSNPPSHLHAVGLRPSLVRGWNPDVDWLVMGLRNHPKAAPFEPERERSTRRWTAVTYVEVSKGTELLRPGEDLRKGIALSLHCGSSARAAAVRLQRAAVSR